MHAALALSLLSLGLLACGAGSEKSADAGVAGDADPKIADARISGEADGMTQIANLEGLLAELRADRYGAMLSQSRDGGWPAAVESGYLVVSTEGLQRVAGDHDDWAGTVMTQEDDFYWAVIDAAPGARYKFTDGNTDYRPDPWSRAYQYDDQGLMSMRAPSSAHLERHFAVGDVGNAIAERTIRVWLPSASATHLLYAHDGQNLFDPGASFGGWKLNAVAPAGLAIVGIDNAGAERLAEYSHVDDVGATSKGDAYADYVHDVIRPLIRSHYGEPEKLGTLGSSLGGLISLHIADRYPGQYDFAGSLSGTLGWGSIDGQGTDTMIARYAAAGHRDTALYIDSGGNGTTCADSDGDGTNDDDETASDNYCETRQMESTLVGLGYQYDIDLWHWHEPGAAHNEAAWAARVFRPLQEFMSL
tara:strand:- start:20003 stop:21256 length:1254 start_codon:yes stop_codon:yes gene_type:complete